MNRRHWIARVTGLIAASILPFRVTAASTFPLNKSRAEWKRMLPTEAYVVLFEEGTERAGSSSLNGEKRTGTGWPSFWQPLPSAVGTSTDFKHRISLQPLRGTSGPCLR